MPTLLGIDIGSASVKVAVVHTSYRQMALVGLGSADIGPEGRGLAMQAAVVQALGKPGTGDAIATALEGASATTRLLALPASAQRQLAEIIPFELEAQVPLELADAVFDYRVLKSAPGVEPGMLPVLAGVAPIADVRALIGEVKQALSVEPERVSFGAMPLANLVAFCPPLAEATSGEQTAAIVDLGVSSSSVVILRGGEPVFLRTLSQGTLGLPESAPKLAREIRLTLNAFRAAGGSAPGRVFLCGGGAFVSGAESFLAAELEMPVSQLPPPAIELGEAAQARAHELPRFARALGLALSLTGRTQGLDLRRGPLAFERGWAWMREKIPVLAGLGAVLAVSFLFSACSQLYSTSKEQASVDEALGIVTKEVFSEETTDPDRAQELLAQQAGLDEDPMPHSDAFDVMVKLSEDIPQSMVHDIEELDVQKGHVTVHGIVGSIPDAQSIAGSLRNEPCFSDVKVARTSQMVGGDRQKYVLEFELKCPEDTKGTKKKKSEGAPEAASSAEEKK